MAKFFSRSVLALVLICSYRAPAFAGTTPGAPGFSNNADYAPAADLINRAQKFVDIEIYEMDDPAVIGALRAALERGVRIRIVEEPRALGNPCHVFDEGVGEQEGPKKAPPHHSLGAVSCAEQQRLVRDVNAAGGRYVPFRKETLCPGGKGCFQHGKILVVDAERALITTGNFNVSNLCDRAASPAQCDRDYSLVTTDEDVVRGLEAVFEADLAGESYDLRQALPPGAASKITVGSLALESLVRFIGSARFSVQIENQYLKEPTLNQALVDAAQRGVKVDVTVASACSFGKPKPSEEAVLTSIFQEFDGAGIRTRMFTRNIQVGGYPGYLHAKAIVVDGQHAWIGSSNGSKESLFKNREFGVYFDTRDDVAALANNLTADFGDANAESWEDGLNCAENNR
jgi:phosphatidylserine/phosphatidylglycerophosphate/cardiolipin synthase-like enzyme